MLLQRVLGSGPHVKRGSGQGKLAKAAAAASAGNFAVGGNFCVCNFYFISTYQKSGKFDTFRNKLKMIFAL